MQADRPPAALITLANEKQRGRHTARFNLHSLIYFYLGAEENEFVKLC